MIVDPVVVCNGDTFTDIVFRTANTNGPSGTIYSWTNDNTNIGLGAQRVLETY